MGVGPSRQASKGAGLHVDASWSRDAGDETLAAEEAGKKAPGHSNPDPDRYLRAVAAVEATNSPATALPSYHAATQRWPRSSLAWLGLGNASYTQGKLRDAEEAYRKVLSIDESDAVAMNNLAQVYVDMGCRGKALATIDAALSAVDEKDPVHSHLLLTRQAISQDDTGSRCR